MGDLIAWTRLGPMKVGRRPGLFPRCASRCGENCEQCRLAWPQLSKAWVERLGLWDAGDQQLLCYQSVSCEVLVTASATSSRRCVLPN